MGRRIVEVDLKTGQMAVKNTKAGGSVRACLTRGYVDTAVFLSQAF